MFKTKLSSIENARKKSAGVIVKGGSNIQITTNQSKEFVFVLEPGFTMHAFSSAAEVLRLVSKLSTDHTYSYFAASITNEPIPASNGFFIIPDKDIEDISYDTILVIISGAGALEDTNGAFIEKIRKWSRQRYRIWGISSGVVRIAQAGLLGGRRVAAHWEDAMYLKEHYPNIDVTSLLFVTDEEYPTCSGGGAAADLMLNYIRNYEDSDLTREIAARLIIDDIRDGRLRQNSPVQLRYATTNKIVFAAIKMMQDNIYDQITISEIAHHNHCSQRQLERLFKSEFNQTPTAVYSKLRMTEARQEVLQGRRPIIDIALDYGLSSSHFSKTYRKVFGTTPYADRKNTSE